MQAAPRPPLATRTRARLVWWTLRLVPYPRLQAWHETGRLRPFEALLRSGDIQILGGLVPRLLLRGEHFVPWGAQAFTVLTGTHEVAVQEALRRTLPEGATFLDVGANIGVTTLVAAAIVGPTGRVLALDPQRECVAATRANAEANGFGWVEVRPAAAGAATGHAEVIVTADALWTRLASVGEHELEVRRDRVAVLALDDLLDEGWRPDVVKIDVEGAELDVLAGMRRMLEEVRPVVVAEMHGRNAEWVTAMAGLGYRTINLDGPEPVETADGNVHVLASPDPR